MKHNLKRAVTLLLTICLCAVLCGCAGSFDAHDYVQGGLDVLYKGEVSEEYLKLVSDSKADCLAAYGENVQAEVKSFCERFYLDENNTADIEELYKGVFAAVKYETGEAEKTATGYCVPVTVQPLSLFRDSYELLDKYDREFTQRFADGEFAELEGSAIESEYVAGMIDLLSAELDEPQYLDAETVMLHLKSEGKGVYTLDPDDMAKLHETLIAY